MEVKDQLPAAGLRPSATVILIRESSAGPAVFLLRRHSQSPVMPSVYVFPGGTLRSDDTEPFPAEWGVDHALVEAFTARLVTPHDASFLTNALWLTAIRETFEEAGVLLGKDDTGRLFAAGSVDAPGIENLASERVGVHAGRLTMHQVFARHRLRPAFEELILFSHWRTPEGVRARFDTWFFLASMPDQQQAIPCKIETEDGIWMPPREALEAAAGGSLTIVFPTLRHLQRLAEANTLPELLHLARTKPIRRVQGILTGGASNPTVIGVGDDW